MAKPTTETRKRIKSCFILAPWGTDLKVIRAVLRERSIEPVVAAELTSTTGSVLSDITAAIAKADLVLAVLPERGERETIMFELGLAYGLHKPLLVMAPDKGALPVTIEEFQYIRADAQNREALSFALDQTLAAKPQSRPRKSNVEKTKPLGAKVEPLLAALRSQPATESELRDLIACIGPDRLDRSPEVKSSLDHAAFPSARAKSVRA